MTKEEALSIIENAKVRLESGCTVQQLHEAMVIAGECIREAIEAEEKWIREKVKR